MLALNRSALFKVAVGSAVSVACGMASTIPDLGPAASAVAQLVAGLGVNYISERLSTVVGPGTAGALPTLSDDLGRVTKHALLVILYETAQEQQVNADEVVKAAATEWDSRLFPDADPTEHQLVELMRRPAELGDAEAQAIARQLLPSGFEPLHAVYSSAIRHQFASVFGALLHTDDRAFRGVILYLLRLNHADLAALQGTAAQILQLLRNPQPHLDRFETLRNRVSSQFFITDLQFKRRATTYRLPPSLNASLSEWLASPHPFQVLKLTGAAGMGKSRLALEICEWCHSQNWLAGFVPDKGWPETWTPLCDTIAVLDYAASKSINGRSSFQWLESLYQQVHAAAGYPNRRPARVRVILIDRSDQGPLWTEWRTSEIATDLEKVTFAVDLKPDRVEFDLIVEEEFQRRRGRRPSNVETQRINDVASRLRDDFRPLFALLTADAVINTSNAGTPVWSPELLLENILKAQIRKWHTAGLQDSDLNLLFEATATQGACNKAPDFAKRRDKLPPATFAALQGLSDPTEGLGPVVPDLLGEFFVLMRLRGEASTGSQQPQVIANQSWEIWNRSSELESTARFAGRLLEDYLPWTPQVGVNPAEQIMEQALQQIRDGFSSVGLGVCLFAVAWNRPHQCDWSNWLMEWGGVKTRFHLIVCAWGLFNATAYEPDPAKCLAIVDRIDALHRDHGQEQGVREHLAKALVNAAAIERDLAKCLAIVDRIDALHRDNGQEPAVREQLANALHNATVQESDSAKRITIADRIDALHRDHGKEPAVRQRLARALYNGTVDEPDPARRLEIANRIDALHRDHGQERAVREQLAKALVNAANIERDLAKCLAIADRVDALHRDYGQEPAVREQLIKTCFIVALNEPNLEMPKDYLKKLLLLRQRFPDDPIWSKLN